MIPSQSKISSDYTDLKDSTVKEYLTVQKEGKRQVRRKVKYYNPCLPTGRFNRWFFIK
jgi:hypothetical protein